jgi:hypothetical protein
MAADRSQLITKHVAQLTQGVLAERLREACACAYNLRL